MGRQTADLVWNLYLQSSTGTISVSRMYLAPGSAQAVTLVLIQSKEIMIANKNDQCDKPCLVQTPALCTQEKVACKDESLVRVK